MSNETLSPNRMEFTAEAIPLFLKAIIAGLSMLIYVPAPAKLTELLQYVLGHLRFSDGTTAQYNASPESLKQPLIGVTGMLWAQILLSRMFDSPILGLAFTVVLGLGQAYFAYQLIKIIFSGIVTSNGSHLNFAASLEDYIKWQLVILGAGVIPGLITAVLPVGAFLGGLLAIAMFLLTLALYGLAFTLYYKWFTSQVQGGTRVPGFQAEPLQFVLRMVGMGLFCCLIVTIPWAMLWFMKWQSSQVSLPARASAAGYSF